MRRGFESCLPLFSIALFHSNILAMNTTIVAVLLLATLAVAQTTTNSTANSTTTSADTLPPSSPPAIVCSVDSSQMMTLVAALISFITGASGGTLITHRMMNSVCIKNAHIEGNSAVIDIHDNTTTSTATTAPAKTGLLTSLGGVFSKSSAVSKEGV